MFLFAGIGVLIEAAYWLYVLIRRKLRPEEDPVPRVMELPTLSILVILLAWILIILLLLILMSLLLTLVIVLTG